MIWLLAGVGALLAGLWLLRSFAAADSVRMAKWIRYGGATVLLTTAAYLTLTGRTPIALLLAGWAMLLLGRKAATAPQDAASQPGRKNQNSESRPARPGMSRQEALDILGLHQGASADEIRAAHKRLMQTCHPDHGGSTYLAARINAAKDVLLS